MNNLRIIPSKEQLVELYSVQHISMTEISKIFGYTSFHPIKKLLLEHDIPMLDFSVISDKLWFDQYGANLPSKDTVIELMKTDSVRKICQDLDISRNIFDNLLRKYDIQNNYMKNFIDNDLLNEQVKTKSINELCKIYNVRVCEIRRRLKGLPSKNFNRDEILHIVNNSDVDISSKGFAKHIKITDERVHDSIMNLTKDHIIQSNKITERLYRIYKEYQCHQIDSCVHCDIPLPFMTYTNGYGSSSNQICKKCHPKHSGFGVSPSSQELFKQVYSKLSLNLNDICYFNDLNKELHLYVTDDDKKLLIEQSKHLNSKYYLLDFVLNKKVIEFDGSYWHKSDKEELAKDIFIRHKGFEILHVDYNDYMNDKEGTILKCINYLTT